VTGSIARGKQLAVSYQRSGIGFISVIPAQAGIQCGFATAVFLGYWTLVCKRLGSNVLVAGRNPPKSPFTKGGLL
jgi:hypothetical protein